jgi:hypothetical protein
MDNLNQIWVRLGDLLAQMASLPRWIVDAIKHRKVRAIAKLREVERLDRIRNPSKYLGK